MLLLVCVKGKRGKSPGLSGSTQGIKSELGNLNSATIKSIEDGPTSFIQQRIFLYTCLDKIGQNQISVFWPIFTCENGKNKGK